MSYHTVFKKMLTNYINKKYEQEDKTLREKSNEINALFKKYKKTFGNVAQEVIRKRGTLSLAQVEQRFLKEGVPSDLVNFLLQEMISGNYPDIYICNPLPIQSVKSSHLEVIKREDNGDFTSVYVEERQVGNLPLLEGSNLSLPPINVPSAFYEKFSELLPLYEQEFSTHSQTLAISESPSMVELLGEVDTQKHWFLAFLEEWANIIAQQDNGLTQFNLVKKQLNPITQKNYDDFHQKIKTYRISVNAIISVLNTLHLRNINLSPANLSSAINMAMRQISAETAAYIQAFVNFHKRNCAGLPEREKQALQPVIYILTKVASEFLFRHEEQLPVSFGNNRDNYEHSFAHANTFDNPASIALFNRAYKIVLQNMREIENKTNPGRPHSNPGASSSEKMPFHQANTQPKQPSRTSKRVQARKEKKKEQSKQRQKEQEKRSGDKSSRTARISDSNRLFKHFSGVTDDSEATLSNTTPFTVVSSRQTFNKTQALKNAWDAVKGERYDSAIKKFLEVQAECVDKQSDSYYAAEYGQARCYLKKGAYEKVAHMIQAMPEHWKEGSYPVACDLVRCYEHLGQFPEAIERLRNMLKTWKNDPFLLHSLANCYTSLGKPYVAVSIHQLFLKEDPNNLNGIMNLIRAYMNGGNYYKALAFLDKIDKRHEQETFVMLTKAKCYGHLGQEKQALVILSTARNLYPNNKQVLERYISSLMEVGHYKDAFEELQKAQKNYGDEPFFLVLFSQYFLNIKNYDQAIICLNNIKNNDEQSQYLLERQATLYRVLNRFEKANQRSDLLIKYYPSSPRSYREKLKIAEEVASPTSTIAQYDELLRKFPHDILIYLNKAIYLNKIGHGSAEAFLRKAIQKFPHHARLHYSLALSLDNEARYDEALSVLQKALISFRDCKWIYLGLISHYLKTRNIEKAIQIRAKINDLFVGNKRLFYQIDNLFSSEATPPSLLEAHSESDKKEENASLQVKLPSLVGEIFTILKAIPGNHFLVGSTVIKLLEQKDDKFIDHDFTSDCNPEDLFKLGFTKDWYIPNLFTLKIESATIDVTVYKREPQMSVESWLQENAHYRDFTICSLYLDSNGKLHDPLGKGLSDLKKGILNTYGDPVLLFLEDPVRLFRAIKYMVAGFKPSQALQEAMLNWDEEQVITHDRHIISVVIRHLETVNDPVAYVKALCNYGLFEKLFNGFPSVDSSNKIDGGYVAQFYNVLIIRKKEGGIFEVARNNRESTNLVPKGEEDNNWPSLLQQREASSHLLENAPLLQQKEKEEESQKPIGWGDIEDGQVDVDWLSQTTQGTAATTTSSTTRTSTVGQNSMTLFGTSSRSSLNPPALSSQQKPSGLL